jgi:hypothetical protein
VRTSKLTRALCLALFAAPLVSIAQQQNSQSAPGSTATGAAQVEPLPELKPPGLPRVVCRGNQLTIAANNSTLSSILAEVSRCIGAKIDIPSSDVDSRFYDTIGPGPIQEVLASLLGATSYNYVIGFSDADPNKVESVLLIARADSPSGDGDKGGDHPLTPNRRAFQQMQQNFMVKGIPGENDTAVPAQDSSAAANSEAPAAPAASASQDQPANQPPVPDPGEAGPRQPVTPFTSTPSAATPQIPSGSTEDQIKSMQQLFEQRRQMMGSPTASPH